jgi:excisionase family DNA binding protein
VARWLTPAEAARRTGFSTETIYRAIKRGHLKATKPKGTGRIRISDEDLEEWVEAGTVEVSSDPMPNRPMPPKRRSRRFAQVVERELRRRKEG